MIHATIVMLLLRRNVTHLLQVVLQLSFQTQLKRLGILLSRVEKV